MITHLRGKLIEKSPTHAVIECNGVGYFLNISVYTFSNLPEEKEVFLYSHLVVREDAQILYGFINPEEREVFLKLVSVSGVGPSTGRMILSSYSPPEIVQIITSGDVASMKSVKGIGAKTAQRIIVDLQDKISGVENTSSEKISIGGNTLKNEALSALTSLGIDQNKASKTIDAILKSEGNNLKLEHLIKLALKQL